MFFYALIWIWQLRKASGLKSQLFVFSIGNWFAIAFAFSNVWWKMPWHCWANLLETSPWFLAYMRSDAYRLACSLYLFSICQSVYIFIFYMKDGTSFTNSLLILQETNPWFLAYIRSYAYQLAGSLLLFFICQSVYIFIFNMKDGTSFTT